MAGKSSSLCQSAIVNFITLTDNSLFIMHLMYYLDANGKRVYTMKKEDSAGIPTASAHPARFSPDDKFSKERLICKKRFGLLLTQQSTKNMPY